MMTQYSEQKRAAIRPIRELKKGMEEAMTKLIPVKLTTREIQVIQ
jgi:hypothetical protein